MKRIVLLMLIVMSGLNFKSMAQGDLLITPKRVIFEGNKQMEELSLVNTGKDTTTYSISFLQYNMQEDGSIVIIQKPDSGQMFADPFLRLFPRQVTLAPGEPQVIMLQCRRTADMRAGEYRSHLYFRSEKNYKPLGLGNVAKDTMLLSVQLIPVYGMSIPVIIRAGAVNANAKIVDLKLGIQQDSVQYIRLSINRTGNISLYGDIKIQFIPMHGNPYEINGIRGVGIYTNIDKRNVVIKLKTSQGRKLTNGKLEVQYVSNDDRKKPVVYAEGELEVK